MLSPRWHKVLKDLWGNKARTLLAVMAIAAGVFAVGMISSAYFVIDHDINVTYVAIHPAHGVLTTEPFDEGLVKATEQLSGVEEAEGRTVLGSMSIPLSDGKKYSLTMTAVEDIFKLRLDRLKLLSGHWPGKLEMVVLPSRYAQVGELLKVELPDGRIRELRVSGTVEDLSSDAVGPVDLGISAYVDMMTIDALNLPRDFNHLYYRVSGDAPTQSDVEAARKDIERLLARDGVEVVQSSVRTPNQHLRFLMAEGLLGVLAIIGTLLIVLGGLLVTNTVSSLLAQQVRQIGIMKAIGALFGQVLGMYLVLASGFGAMASVIAVPIAPRTGYALAQGLAWMLNFGILEFRIFPAPFLLMLMVGLFMPCLAALVPVLNALRVTVREAIASHGIATQFGDSIIDHLVEHIRGLPRPLLMSVRNTFRRKGRLFLTLFSLALAGAIFMSVFTTRASIVRSFEPVMHMGFSDLNLDFKYAYHTERITQLIEQTPGVVHAEGWAVALGEILDANGYTVTDRFTIYAPPLNSPMTDRPPIVEGRWLRETDRNALVIATEIVRRHPTFEIGDTVRLRVGTRTAPFVIVGKYQDVWGENAKKAFSSYSYISQLLGEPGCARSYKIMLQSSEPVLQEQMGSVVLDAVKQPGDTPSFLTGASLRGAIYNSADAVAVLLMVVALLIVAVGGISLTSTMSMNVLERTREIGVMRAIGARNADIRQMVIVEGVSVGALSWLIGLGLSFPLSYTLCNIVGLATMGRPLDYVFDWTGVAIWLGLVVVIAALASLWPAINAARMTVRDALAYE